MSEKDIIKEHGEGVAVKVKVRPGSSRQGVRVLENGEIIVHVHSSPEKGKANQELIKLLSRRMGVSASRLQIVRGEKSRRKTILIKDIDTHEVIEHLR